MTCVGAGTSNVMPVRGLIVTGVRVADLQLEVVALERGAVADALDLEPLLEALRDALDHVRDQGARQAVQLAVGSALGRTGHGDRAALLLDLHALRHDLLERAERARDRDAAGLQLNGHAGGDFDGCFSDSTHVITR